MRKRIRRLDWLSAVLVGAALLAARPSRAGPSDLFLDTQPLGPGPTSIELANDVGCVLGETRAARTTGNIGAACAIPWKAYTLLSPSGCTTCPPESGPTTVTITAVKIFGRFVSACSLPVKISFVEAVGGPGCLTPDAGQPVGPEVNLTLTATSTAYTTYAVPVPLADRREFTSNVFVCVSFEALGSCSGTFPFLVHTTVDPCVPCQSYFSEPPAPNTLNDLCAAATNIGNWMIAVEADGHCPNPNPAVPPGVPTEGLVGYWPFSNNANDDSGNGNNGAVHGAIPTSDLVGTPTSAYYFDGVDDYIDVGANAILRPPLPLTIAGWVRNDGSDDNKRQLFTNDYRDNIYTGVWVNTRPVVGVSIGDGGAPGPSSRRSKFGATTLAVGTWYHIAAVIRGPLDMSIYVNGADDGGTYGGTGGPLVYGGGPGNIGRKDADPAGPPYSHFGAIDEILFYNRALTAGEIQAIYLASPVLLSGTVEAAIQALPDTTPASLRGLPNVSVQVFHLGQPVGASSSTDLGGGFSFPGHYGTSDVLRATLSSPINEATRCVAAPPAVCVPTASAFHDGAPGALMPIHLVWPASGDAANEVAHAFYFAEKVAREYWTDVIVYPPNDQWKVLVGDDTPGLGNAGGGLADPGKKAIHLRSGYAYYPDVLYHEFTHRMIAQLVGTSLANQRGGIMAVSMDEGFADYFAASFANQPQINRPPSLQTLGSNVLRDLDPSSLLGACIPGAPELLWCLRLQTCFGGDKVSGYNTRVFGCALWNLRKRLVGAGLTSAEIDRWIWGAIGPFALRIPRPEDRTFLEFYRQLRDYTLLGSQYETELTDAFAKFNIKDDPDEVCYTRPVIQGVDRVVTDGHLYATATWGTVPGVAGYNVYVRRFGGIVTGLDLGILVAESIPNTSFTFIDPDTTATIAFLVTAIDSSGTEGPESDETPLVTGVSGGSSSPVLSSISAWPNPSRGVIHFVLAGSQAGLDAAVYGLDGRLIRTLWRGRRPVVGFDWDGRDAGGRRVPTGVYFVRVRLGEGALYRRVLLFN